MKCIIFLLIAFPCYCNAQYRVDDSIADAKLLLRQKQAQLGIDYFVYWYPKYSSGVDVEFAVANYSKYVIRYATFYLNAIDAVGGKIYSLSKPVEKLKCIGPILPDKRSEYHFERAFWSKVIDSMYFSKIEIEYMNGVKKTIVNTDKIIGRHEWTEDYSDFLK